MTKDGRSLTRCSPAGFSLLELLVVVLIMMIIGTIALPNMVTVVSNARLRGGATNLSGLMQNARMLAVNQNKRKSIHFTVLANGAVAFVKDAGDTSNMTSGDPQSQLGTPLTQMIPPFGVSDPTQMDSTILGFTPLTSDPTFSPTGLPCSYSGGSCTPNVGFVYYFKDRRPMGKSGWAAVSISPAGRLKRWFWNGSAWGD
jgi:Tfp pilus assembly protein FimT